MKPKISYRLSTKSFAVDEWFSGEIFSEEEGKFEFSLGKLSNGEKIIDWKEDLPFNSKKVEKIEKHILNL